MQQLIFASKTLVSHEADNVRQYRPEYAAQYILKQVSSFVEPTEQVYLIGRMVPVNQ